MAFYEKIIDEVYEYIKNIVVKGIEDKEKKEQFDLVWDTVRDEYERMYGRDYLYNKMWLENKFVQKEMLHEVRKYPASREFLEKLFIYMMKKIGQEEAVACRNFVIIFYKNLIMSEEFSEKMIRVRQDIESGQMATKCMNEMGNPIRIEAHERIAGNDFGSSDNEHGITFAYINNLKMIDLYANNYNEVMFMQKSNEPQIKLKDLYVENEYESIIGKDENKGSLLKYIEEFCNEENKGSVLFIEGHAGIGKSSLISKMAYEYKNNGNLWRGKELAIIQLRNLAKNRETLDVFNPWSDYKNYLQYSGTIKEFMRLMDNTILILDGFDELCLVEDIRLDNKLKYVANIFMKLEDYQCSCKVIMTTRPNYLARYNEWYKIYYMPKVIRLNHFSVIKRKEWIGLAKKAGMKIDDEVEKSIVSVIENDIEVVASTPLTLYLIVHERIVLSKNDELWSVYQNIFGKEIMRKRYDHLNFDGELTTHPGEFMASIIYEITKEIAYYMFQKGVMDILWDEIESKIEDVRKKEDEKNYKKILKRDTEIRDLLKDSYALFNYYKETDFGGGIAFYHNYIREFFVQEKVNEELNKIYAIAIKEERKYERKHLLKEMSIRLYELLKYGRLSDKTIDFISSHGRVYSDRTNSWINLELKFHYLRELFTNLIVDNQIMEYNENYILNIWLLMEVVNSFNKKDDNYNEVYESSKIEDINANNCLAKCLEIISKNVAIQRINFKGVDWRGKEIRNVLFVECKFTEVIMNGTCLSEVEFKKCEMQNVKLNGSEMKVVTFEETKLGGAVLNGTIMSNCLFLDCFMDSCNLNGAKMRATRFNRSNIESAYLYGTDFGNSSIDDKERVLSNILSFKYALLEKMNWEDDFREIINNELKVKR